MLGSHNQNSILINFEPKENFKMSFYSQMEKILNQRTTRTENGAVSFATSGNALVDMNFKVPSYRGATEQTILSDFLAAFAEDPVLALKWMFYAGDVRQGLGERRLFKTLVKNVLPKYKHLIKLIPEYSRWDIVTELFGTTAEDDAIALIKTQLDTDLKALKDNKPISLLGKWLPSVNTSSKETVAKAHLLCKALGMHPAQYRKTLSKLRSYSNVIEVKLCANKWNEIDYQTVPSKANLKYKDSFLKHDEARRREFLNALDKGEVKINSSVAFPHDIVHAYKTKDGWSPTAKAYDAALEGMWKNLPKIDMSKPLIVVRDGSGSMDVTIPNSNIQAEDVATALAIYCAERNVGGFKNTFITFDEHPTLIKLSDQMSLRDKLVRTFKEDSCGSTNIEATMDLILKTAVDNKMKQEDIPDVLIISDMEFNGATTLRYDRSQNRLKTLFETIAGKFKAKGYKMPGLVFWNVNSRTNAMPLQQNDQGLKLLSGFSQNILKMAMSNKLDPFEVLKDVLLSTRYSPIV